MVAVIASIITGRPFEYNQDAAVIFPKRHGLPRGRREAARSRGEMLHAGLREGCCDRPQETESRGCTRGLSPLSGPCSLWHVSRGRSRPPAVGRARGHSTLGRLLRPLTGGRLRGLSPLLSVGVAASRLQTTALAINRRAAGCGSLLSVAHAASHISLEGGCNFLQAVAAQPLGRRSRPLALARASATCCGARACEAFSLSVVAADRRREAATAH